MLRFNLSDLCLKGAHWVLWVLLAGLSSLSYAESAIKSKKEQEATQALIAQLDQISSISGSFVQYAVDQKNVTIQESRGSFKAMRPGFFFWRTEAPLEQEIYSDGAKVTVYDPDLEQATIQAANSNIDNTPAVLFSGDPNRVSSLYLVEMTQVEESSDSSIPVNQYLLTPRSNESLFDRMRLRFQGKHLTEIRMRDSLGQESTIRFIQTEVNPDLKPSDFVPTLPEGTDIIEDLS